MSKKKEGKAKTKEEEVEELLREAQDEVLLRLSVDSHIVQSKDPPPTQLRSVDVDPDLKAVLGDDLSARFAALKASSSATTIAPIYVDLEEDEDDEVEKLMRWAKDAARLDQ